MTFAERGLMVLGYSGGAEQVVPPAGHTAWLTTLTSASMAFLAVFALALSLATGRLAENWASQLARTATLRISAPAGQIEEQVQLALRVLQTTPGIANARALDDAEERKLLEPWFGPDLPLDTLPIPRLIEIVEDDAGFDTDGLRLRLQGEVPGAVLDDHTRWRQPLVAAATMLRGLGWLCLGLITATLAGMVTLAANASLAANRPVIRVLRLIGARDTYIAKAFVRRFTLRALGGAAAGAALGLIAIAALPDATPEGGFLTGLGFRGWSWIWPLLIPPLSAFIALAATRLAAFRTLRGMT